MFVLVLCAILLIWVIWVHNQTETFITEPVLPAIDPKLVATYQTFATTIYNPFLLNWQNAIVSLVTADIPQEPLTSPSQTSSASAPIPPQHQMNAYIENLSQQIGKPLPPITDPLPETIDILTFSTIAPKIPKDPIPYTNALTWMNQKMEDAHTKLQSALKGESFTNLEGFDNQICQDVSQCFHDNPQFAQQCAAAIQTQQKETQQNVTDQLAQFMKNPGFQAALQSNQQLIAQSKQVQDQAKSGELLNQVNLPTEPEIKYTLPEGSDKLQYLDASQLKEVKEASPSMFSLKTLMDQINANLR